MTNKIIKIIILFLIFLSSSFILLKLNKPLETRILKVIEADEFYVDLNKNNEIDNFEHVKLKNIKAFKPINKYIDREIKSLGISQEEYLKNGYMARTWAKENLKNKKVEIYNYKSCFKNKHCKVDIYIENENLAEILLKNGLAYPLNNQKARKSFIYFNVAQVKNNVKELSKLDFVLINLNSNIIHKLSCKLTKEITSIEIILKKDAHYLKEYFCKICNININKSTKEEYNIPKSKNIYKKSISKSFENIDIYLLNPLEYKKPNIVANNEFSKRLIKEINNSKSSIYIALYGISDQPQILNALKEAKNRNVEIEIVSDTTSAYPNTKDILKDFNAKYHNDNNIMHNKFFIFDEKTILTGSSNISPSGSGGYSANIAFFIKSNKIAKIYLEEFKKLKKLTKEKTLTPNQQEENIKAYFSPQDDIYNKAILPNIKNAKQKIYISAFFLTDKNLIEELIKAKRRKLEVLILLDAVGAKSFSERISKLRNEKIPTIVENWGGKNHEKTIMIDDEILISGSANFSKSAFYKNHENILIIKNPQIAKWYGDYYLYLFNSIDKKYLKLIPRAESKESFNSCSDGIDNNFDGKIDLEDDGCKI